MASSVPAARTALHEGLAALTGVSEPLEGVGIYRTGLWKEAQAHDRITVGNARDVQRQVAALSTQTPMDEEYTLLVMFEVYRTGDDLEFVEDRLWALITAVEQFVMADKTLNNTVRRALPAGVDEQSGPSSTDEDTLLAMATLQIDVQARVFLN